MFTLAPLPFAYNALEPFIDAATMKLHHDKHHQTYVDKLNDIVKNNPDLENKTLEDLLTDPRSKNMAGGVYNHDLFWRFLSPDYRLPTPDPKTIEQFSNSAMSLFGSGWVWLTDDLKVISTPNQDAPPKNVITGIDLWEHAYYLKYQNRRKDYLEAFLKLVLK